jgi:hypothetical protein
MGNALEKLKVLLARECDSKEIRWNDPTTCSGMIYGYAADGLEEGIDVITTVEEAMEDVCDGGLQCDQCKVYNVLQLFVSDVEIIEVPEGPYRDTYLIMAHLNEAQLTAMSNALKMFVDTMWDNMRDLGEEFSEEDKVELQEEIRVAEEMYMVVSEHFQ